MNEPIYVFGHKNPDTDSICSAIAYAELKRSLGYKNVKACRLGKINKETAFVLDYFGVSQPECLQDVKIKLSDLDLYNPVKLSADSPVKKAWDVLIGESGSRIIPVINDDGSIHGLVSMGDITKLFMEVSDESIVSKYEILFDNLLEILDGEVKFGSYKYEKISGNFFIGANIPEDQTITDKDIVLTGRLETALRFAHVHNCGCVVLTDGITPLGFDGSDTAVVSVDYTMFKVVSLVSSAISLRSILKKTDIISFSIDTYLEDIIDVMKTSKHRNFPVVDREGLLAGVVSRRHMIDAKPKSVILVDHNERSQSVEGLGEAKILEIIDHHRVADIQTESPLYIRSEPVGCTGTIVYRIYKENKIEVKKEIAGIILGAILSDTLMFSSPTCTDDDRNSAWELAEIAGIEIEDFGKEMFSAGTSLDDYSASEMLGLDRKRFSFSKHVAYISQVSTMDLEKMYAREDEIVSAMEEFYEKSGCDLVVLIVTDIIAGGSELIAIGRAKDLVINAFGMNRDDIKVYLPGVVSRKKQIIPQLTHAAHAF